MSSCSSRFPDEMEMLSFNLGLVPHFEKKIRSVLSYFAYCISWKIKFRQVAMLKMKHLGPK